MNRNCYTRRHTLGRLRWMRIVGCTVNRTRRLATFAVVVSFLSVAMTGPAAQALTARTTYHVFASVKSDASVTGDGEHDAYVGTGGLLLPRSFTGGGGTRKRVAGCLSCTWRYTVYCAQDSDSMCAHAVTTCPSGQVRYRVWFGTDADWLKVVGSVCWGWKRPVTRVDIDEKISQVALRTLPPIVLGSEPPKGTLTSVPVNFHTGQPSRFTPQPMKLAGYTVKIVAIGRWRWSWGDASSQWTSSPGDVYPHMLVAHRYRKPGKYLVNVKATWSATYTVAGIGTFEVLGDPVTQDDSLEVYVASSRALLTNWK